MFAYVRSPFRSTVYDYIIERDAKILERLAKT